jgi:hypothetical protein
MDAESRRKRSSISRFHAKAITVFIIVFKSASGDREAIK